MGFAGKTCTVTGATPGVLVNGTVLECTEADWSHVMDVNVSSAFRLSREVRA